MHFRYIPAENYDPDALTPVDQYLAMAPEMEFEAAVYGPWMAI